MALQTLEIYKSLPKTNCRDCGCQTCLAFAMQLAVQKARLGQCPHLDEKARAALSEESEMAIKSVRIGEREIGNETVVFRHEKTFNHESLICLEISDSLSDSEIGQKTSDFLKAKFDRVGHILTLDMILVRFESGDAKRFACVVDAAAKAVGGIIIECNDINAAREAAKSISGRGAILCKSNHAEFACIAREHGLSIIVGGNSLAEIAENAETVTKISDSIILNVDLGSFRDNVRALTQIRRMAIKQRYRNLGFPAFARASDTAEAGVYLMRYASIVTIKEIDNSELLPLLTLRQNIYTDPQKPLQVEQSVYPIGAANKDSPLLVTTNFSLTYFSVSSEISSSKVPAHLLVVDTEGMSVLTGYAADKFSAETVTRAINKLNAAEMVNRKQLVIPGLVAQMSGALEDESGWKVAVGPREARELRKFMATLK
ncbi:MAG: acetyl-CoA decarbonylase/synthase complex subunit gamma [archaeon]